MFYYKVRLKGFLNFIGITVMESFFISNFINLGLLLVSLARGMSVYLLKN